MPRSRSTGIQSEPTRRRSPRAFTSPPAGSHRRSSNFSVKVVLPASGCEMIAKVRRRAISSVRVNRLLVVAGIQARWQAVPHAGPGR